MKTLDEFNSFYINVLQSSLNELEVKRKKNVKKVFMNLLYYFLFVVVIVLLGIFINGQIQNGKYLDGNEDNIAFIISIILALFTFLFVLGANHKIKTELITDYKNKIIRVIVNFLHPNLKYDPNNFIQQNHFAKSELYLRQADKYFGDDLVEGRIGDTHIAFSEIHAKYRSKNDDDEGGSKWHSLFDGLFFMADFNKNFTGKYFVLPDFAEKSFGRVGKFFQKMNIGRGKLISLEDPDFEKAFAVYGTDQVEARYILSSALMRRLLDFKNQCKKNIMISFVGSHLFIAIPYRGQLFEPSFYTRSDKPEKINEYFRDLNLVVGVVEELNLNTRIWSKQ